jgi:lipopolysaccharide transport system permease protein
MTEQGQDFELIIRPKYGIFDINWKEIKEFHELLFFLALREIKIRYKQSIMGIGWAMLQPFFTMIVFTLIFGGIAHLPSEGIPYPLFSYSGLLLWTYFSVALGISANSLVANAGLLSKVYLPRIFIPAAPCLAGIVDYLVAMVILVGMMIYYQFMPPVTIILLPVIVLLTLLLTAGAGFWLSSIAVKYRDVKFIVPFFIQLLMFLSPVIYPTDIVGENFQWLLMLNPLTGLINAHRAVILGHVPVDYTSLGFAAVIVIIIFLSGILYLRRTEKYFADLV